MMKQKHMPFNADAQSKQDHQIEVINYIGKMAICGEDGVVYITKEQAMEFWDLQEKVFENSLGGYGKCQNVIRQFGGSYSKSCLNCGHGPCKTGTIGDL